MFDSSKLIFMPAGVSAMHSPYSCARQTIASSMSSCGRLAFMMRFLAPVLIVAASLVLFTDVEL
jgi:hypothetical protein